MEKENVQAASSAEAQEQKQLAAAGCGESTASSSSASSSAAHMFVFSNNKAGMGSVDKERVNRIIYEMSKNSSYFKQAKLQDDKLDQKVCVMRVQMWRFEIREFARVSRVGMRTGSLCLSHGARHPNADSSLCLKCVRENSGEGTYGFNHSPLLCVVRTWFATMVKSTVSQPVSVFCVRQYHLC